MSVARDRLRSARVVALPVRDNTYSGATTVLLQAMASGKPVVVSRTAAIARGYHLEDGSNCRPRPAGRRPRRSRARSRTLLDDEERATGDRRPRPRDRRAAPDLGPLHGRDPRAPVDGLPHYRSRVTLRRALRSIGFRVRRAGRAVGREVATEVDRVRYRRRGGADLALFHEFAPPPTGGGHQFLRALVAELERRGLVVELNRISRGTPVCLFNSFNFDFRRLRRFARPDCRMVHRVDGPIGVYRGFDDGTDARIQKINRDLADATIAQSRFSLEAHRELGIELAEPVGHRQRRRPG